MKILVEINKYGLVRVIAPDKTYYPTSDESLLLAQRVIELEHDLKEQEEYSKGLELKLIGG